MKILILLAVFDHNHAVCHQKLVPLNNIIIFTKKLLLLLYIIKTLRTVIYMDSPLPRGSNSSSKQFQRQQNLKTPENLISKLSLFYEVEKEFENMSLAPSSNIMFPFVDLRSGT